MDMVMLDKADLMSSESYQKVLQIYFINLSVKPHTSWVGM
ncbi:Uncharacterised protein [Shewanella morhuae]|uniref:Uncharacterized protein n=1 Tax=Shewanella morhuae TaxID=365591 RepID=A0A380C134_9GAMM|nr:Uncharacterised protein [Shewanella morhuae]